MKEEGRLRKKVRHAKEDSLACISFLVEVNDDRENSHL
jgi:hypothetical protein